MAEGFTGMGEPMLEKDSEADREREDTEGYWRILAQALKMGTEVTVWPRSVNSWAMSVKIVALEARPCRSCEHSNCGMIDVQWPAALGQWESIRQNAQTFSRKAAAREEALRTLFGMGSLFAGRERS